MKKLIERLRIIIMSIFGFDENKNKAECVTPEQLALVDKKLKYYRYNMKSINYSNSETSNYVELPYIEDFKPNHNNSYVLQVTLVITQGTTSYTVSLGTAPLKVSFTSKFIRVDIGNIPSFNTGTVDVQVDLLLLPVSTAITYNG